MPQPKVVIILFNRVTNYEYWIVAEQNPRPRCCNDLLSAVTPLEKSEKIWIFCYNR